MSGKSNSVHPGTLRRSTRTQLSGRLANNLPQPEQPNQSNSKKGAPPTKQKSKPIKIMNDDDFCEKYGYSNVDPFYPCCIPNCTNVCYDVSEIKNHILNDHKGALPVKRKEKNAPEGSSPPSQPSVSTNNAQLGASNENVVVRTEENSHVPQPPVQKSIRRRGAPTTVPPTPVRHSYATRSRGAKANQKLNNDNKQGPSTTETPTADDEQLLAAAATTTTSSSSSSATTNSSQQTHDRDCFLCKKKIRKSQEKPCDTCHLNFHKLCATSKRYFGQYKAVVENYIQLHKNKTRRQMDAGIGKLHDCVLSETKEACNKCSSVAAANYYTKSKDGIKRANALAEDVATVFQTLATALIAQCEPPVEVNISTLDYATFLKEPTVYAYQRAAIVRRISLKDIEAKSQAKKKADQYNSIEELLLDLEIFIHNRIIISKLNRVVIEKGKQLFEFAKNQSNLISACDSCYRVYYMDTQVPTIECSSPFGKSLLLPCQQPHQMVWYLSNQVWSPAIVYPFYADCSLTLDERKVWIFPLNDDKHRVVDSASLYSYSLNPPKNAKIDWSDERQKDAILKAQYYATHQNGHVINYRVPLYAVKFTNDKLYFKWKSQIPNKRKLAKGWECCKERCRIKAFAAFHMCVQSFCSAAHRTDYLTVKESLLHEHPQFVTAESGLVSKVVSDSKRRLPSTK